MKKIVILVSVLILMNVCSIVDAAPQCPGNLSPDQRSSDPSCFVQSSGSTYVNDGTDNYACGPVYVKPADFGNYYCYACWKNGVEYSRECNGPWHGYWCSNGHGGLPGSSSWSQSYGHWETVTTNKCYYISGVTEWSVCNGGSQVAVTVTWSNKQGTDCTNVPLTRTCGMCGVANGVNTGSAPVSNLCALGTASPVPPTLASNVWTWTCKGFDNAMTTDDVNCSAPRSVDGACNSTATGTYTIDETAYRGALCTSGTPTIASTPFLAYGETRTWGCNGIGTGTSTSATACSATRQRPAASCGPQNGHTTDTIPSSDLCTTPCTSNTVTYDTSGHWQWTCTHPSTEADPRIVNCSAPSCLATTPFELQPYVYLNDNGPNQATMRVTCPHVCCSINDASDTDVVICDGTSGQITVSPGAQTYPAACWYDADGNGTHNGEAIVNHSGAVSTMCTARSCNGQGTCQATPQPATSSDDCTSSCNSDADCSQGRMIETRP